MSSTRHASERTHRAASASAAGQREPGGFAYLGVPTTTSTPSASAHAASALSRPERRGAVQPMSPVRKFVGRFVAVAVIDPGSPTKTGPEQGMDATMNNHDNAARQARAAARFDARARRRRRMDRGELRVRGELDGGLLREPEPVGGAERRLDELRQRRRRLRLEQQHGLRAGQPDVRDPQHGRGRRCRLGETLQYTPPGGSTLIGGSVDVSMYADGGGYRRLGHRRRLHARIRLQRLERLLPVRVRPDHPARTAPTTSPACSAFPADRGGSLYLSAGCGGAAGYACDEGGSEGAWSLVRLWWANLLLSNEATPSASGVGGTLLSPNAAGTAELTLNAADPGGPGVYVVTVQIDGKTVYSGTPNSNGGKCVPVGTSGGALMFDYSQPCPASESVDLPINTTALANGQHTLKVTVQDAAGNSAVVYDGTISTKQPSENSLGALPGPGTSAASAPLAGSPSRTGRRRAARRSSPSDSSAGSPAPTRTARFESPDGWSTGRAIRSRARRWMCCSRSAARRAWR